MRLLVDSHAALWSLDADRRLSAAARKSIADGSNRLWVSAATLWEIAIKRHLGKLRTPDDLPEILAQRGFAELPVTAAHGWAAGALPLHHSDPFDRLLVAQAQLERLVIVTGDPRIRAYGVPTIW